MKTLAAILFEINKPLQIEEIEVPLLKRGQVLVKILATVICRTQYNEIIGLKGEDKYLPHLLGHEASGEVLEVGENVTKVKKGDLVVATWIKGSGLDGGGSEFKFNNHIINAGAITTFQQYSVICENRVVKISPKVPIDIAAVLGCAVPTGVGIITNTLKVAAGSSIAIFGIGGVGGCAVMGARMAGCKSIIAIDISKSKLDFAKKLGATHTINILSANVEKEIKEISNGGVDFAVEATGKKEVMEKAFEVLNDKGTLVIVGNSRRGERISLDPFAFIKGKKIVGSWGGETNPDLDIPKYAEAYLQDKLPLSKLITQRYKLDEINKAMDDMANNMILGRAIIEF